MRSSLYGLALAVALVLSGVMRLAQASPQASSSQPVKVEVYESTTDLKESLEAKDAVSFGSAR
jgi:hypothetical protein